MSLNVDLHKRPLKFVQYCDLLILKTVNDDYYT